jgi:tyrosinase
MMKANAMPALKAAVKGNASTLSIPREVVRKHLSTAESCLLAEVTVQRPTGALQTREFDVIVGAPPEVTDVDADSPYYAGTLAIFGHMHHGMPESLTFAVPLPKKPAAFHGLEAAQVPVNIRVVATRARDIAPLLKAVTVRVMQ